MDWNTFIKKGYAVVQADHQDQLEELRNQIYGKAKELAGDDGEGVEPFLNNFHKRELWGTPLNDFRISMVSYLSEQMDVGKSVFNSFSESLTELLGPDVVVQKTTNLVIQQPGDPNQVPTHRDSPLNSPFEIVVWLPLVDIYGTKGMYVLDRDQSKVALELLQDPETGYEQYAAYAEKEGEMLELSFGQAFLFWPGLVHAVGINTEQETRWALNIRYKNLFSPTGAKGQAEFFKVLHLSPLARMAMEYERERSK